MSALLVGDLHLTSAPRDSYRWRIFELLKNQTWDYDELFLLGDLTDAKDNHPAELVNKLCDALVSLTEFSTIHIIRGNHDGVDKEWPYFRFLNHLRQVRFYDRPTEVLGHRDAVALPHSRNPQRDWQDIDWAQYKVAFAHITVKGAESESGIALESSVSASFFKERHVTVYAGDVHVPQTIRPVTYVGAPYHIRFGDKFKPRVLGLDFKSGKTTDIPIDVGVRRLMVDVNSASELADLKAEAGDQVKVRLHLVQDQMERWGAERKGVAELCKKAGLQLVAVELICEQVAPSVPQAAAPKLDPQQVLAKYAKQHKLTQAYTDVGAELLAAAVPQNRPPK